MMPLRFRILPRLAALLLAVIAVPAFGQAANPPILPDPKLTPGETLDVTLSDIRQTGYSSRVRNVPVAVKREVYASYGINQWSKGEYEIDHLIPLSIGGSNSKKNLWPQSYLTSPWNARVKDRLEYKLLNLVRSGKLDLQTAQQEIAANWIAAYKKYVGPEPKPRGASPVAVEEGTARAAGDKSALKDEDPDTDTFEGNPEISQAPVPAVQSEQVWVNTKSGVIWRPGSEWYGKTKEGKYMPLDEALRDGDHLAHGTGQ